MITNKYDSSDLVAFSTKLLKQSGLTNERATAVAEILVEGDLMGHSTHGLQLLPRYLEELQAGGMAREGAPETISDHGAALSWDGCYLPGPWLVCRAIDEAIARLRAQPVATVVIRRAHHIGCLAAYLRRATDHGLFMLLTCSDPSVASVAPHGGIGGRYTPNPIAVGYPTDTGAVWIDISVSTTTNGMVARLNRTGEKLPGQWLVDEHGEASDDPGVMADGCAGAILPLGGIDLGYKGFALGLIVEALTAGLAGFGRADHETRWGATVFLQLIDPRGFGGRAEFERETGWLAASCRSAPSRAAGDAVRLPGERARALREAQLKSGVALHPDILPALAPWTARLGVAPPAAL